MLVSLLAKSWLDISLCLSKRNISDFLLGRDGTAVWKSLNERGIIDSSNRGLMPTDSPKTAKIMPINPPQNWTSTSTASLESNGVSVTIVSAADCSKPPVTIKNSGIDSVTITPANAPLTNNTNAGANGIKKAEKRSKPIKETSMDTSFEDGGMGTKIILRISSWTS